MFVARIVAIEQCHRKPTRSEQRVIGARLTDAGWILPFDAISLRIDQCQVNGYHTTGG